MLWIFLRELVADQTSDHEKQISSTTAEDRAASRKRAQASAEAWRSFPKTEQAEWLMYIRLGEFDTSIHQPIE